MSHTSKDSKAPPSPDPEKLRQARIKALEAQIADLKKRWPQHSTPPGLMNQLDDLETELEKERRKSLTQSRDN